MLDCHYILIYNNVDLLKRATVVITEPHHNEECGNTEVITAGMGRILQKFCGYGNYDMVIPRER